LAKIGSWWADKGQKHDAIWALASNLKQRQRPRMEIEKRYARLYANRNMLGLDSFNYYRSDSRIMPDEERIKLNVVRTIIDTIHAKIAVEQPRVTVQTNGADFAVRSKAKKIQKFTDGILELSGSYVEMLKAFRDAEIMGTGVVKIYDDWGNIKLERTLKHEILIDEEECYYGRPTQLHQVKTISRAKLIEMFPKFEAKILQANKVKTEFTIPSDISDLVTVIMSWHLPSGPKSKDGRYICCTDNCDLVDVIYDKNGFPFEFIKWSEPQYGFWGTGIVEELQPLQIEINRLLISAQKGMRAASNPMIFIPAGSSISKMHLSNEVGIIIPFVGSPPIIRVHQTVHPEIFQQIETLYHKCFEITGISQLSASGTKPVGVTAQVAMRELQNIESERFSVIQRIYYNAFVNIAKKMIALARDLYADDKTDTEIIIKDRKFIEKINWKDIDLEEDAFELGLDLSSKLPLTRAGRISTFTEWYQAKLIDTDTWRSNINFPDTTEANELLDAPKEYIRETVYKILYDGDMIPPEDHDDLQFAYKYSIMSYQQAKLNKFPEDRIDLLSRYISSLEFKLKAAEPPPPPPMGPQAIPGAPQQPPPGPPAVNIPQ